MFMPNSAILVRDAERLAAFALQHKIASCFDSSSTFVDAGGLMSYGYDVLTTARRVAEFADRIARGAKPADMPIELATRFTLRINLKTAQALGITFPPTFLARADEVIE
jgi:putative ABC transport system substrate-binding protein